MVMETAMEMVMVMAEEKSPKQQSQEPNKDSSGWLERLKKGKWKTPRLRFPKLQPPCPSPT